MRMRQKTRRTALAIFRRGLTVSDAALHTPVNNTACVPIVRKKRQCRKTAPHRARRRGRTYMATSSMPWNENAAWTRTERMPRNWSRCGCFGVRPAPLSGPGFFQYCLMWLSPSASIRHVWSRHAPQTGRNRAPLHCQCHIRWQGRRTCSACDNARSWGASAVDWGR